MRRRDERVTIAPAEHARVTTWRFRYRNVPCMGALLAPPLRSAIDVASDQFTQNRAHMLEQLQVIDALLDEAAAGGGEASTARLRSRGKLPIRERIANVLD